MLRLLAKAIFGSSSKDDPWAPIIEAATEKAVDSTDPRLRAMYGYKQKLREPVTHAVHFVHELGERFSDPVEISRESFASDPRPRAFFSSPERLQQTFSTSPEVQAFLAEPGHRTLDRLYAALAMQLSERDVLVPALKGDRVQHEVKRTRASFDEHRVVLPAVDEKRLRRQLKERAFTTLVQCALERMTERSEQKQGLEKQRGLLRAKLRALRSGRGGLDGLSGTSAPPSDTASLERLLAYTERELGECVASDDVLEANLRDLCDTLSQPEGLITLTQVSRRLTRMGYVVDEEDEEASEVVEFDQIGIRGRPDVCGVLACYPVDELKPGEFYTDKMRRALGASGRTSS
jgi:hypothetical protein